MSTISLRAASRRYGITPSTISRWAARGVVEVVEDAGAPGLPCALDEDSVRVAAEAYVAAGPGKGKRTHQRPAKLSA